MESQVNNLIEIKKDTFQPLLIRELRKQNKRIVLEMCGLQGLDKHNKFIKYCQEFDINKINEDVLKKYEKDDLNDLFRKDIHDLNSVAHPNLIKYQTDLHDSIKQKKKRELAFLKKLWKNYFKSDFDNYSIKL